ncbi:glycosyltransferase family 90 protein [Plicaturopsis crispa FD-325 SS-3]|uniref:Glycosyltransferase family 90 protein n=1 Tax=Plicaturopsis crispa FD-325 SS-3 TaxID=944288 RepID=A0A0C9SWV6_PLICR|nr:glycosyltransferase family 90 protein [Plicaturopsis crispa FD-325 SS-3]
MPFQVHQWPEPIVDVPELAPARRKGPRPLLDVVELPPKDTAQTPKTFDLPPHQYRADGLLTVNPDGAHPIFELTRRNEALWRAKLKRASKTFDQAVREYERRYHRKPPLGFEAWWIYVEENNVQLPDEYDQIYRDLEPFWGMDPRDLQRLVAEREAHVDSYTIGKAAGSPIGFVNMTLPEDPEKRKALLSGAWGLLELLEDVQDFIPPFRAVFSPHDNPDLAIDYELKTMALEAAAARTYIDINSPPPAKEGWLAACPPHSPARRTPFDLNKPPPPQTSKTFIHDHRAAMDPCQHPAHLHQHGQFLSHNYGPNPNRVMIPYFSYCVTTLHHDISPATPIAWVDDVTPRADDPPWEDKVDERLLWRGSNTGIWHAPHTRWAAQQRIRLVADANELRGNASVLRSPASPLEPVGPPQQVRRARLNPAAMDVAFAGDRPFNCEPDTCNALRGTFEWRAWQGQKHAGRYKYVMDSDGNGWSSRFKRLITSNALVFKATVYPEWFTDRIMPWVHYVPVQLDYSDLHDALGFFRGDLNGEGAHDDMARKIATAGRVWSKTFWRKEDLTAYQFRLFLEYARVMSTDREAMSYKD